MLKQTTKEKVQSVLEHTAGFKITVSAMVAFLPHTEGCVLRVSLTLHNCLHS